MLGPGTKGDSALDPREPETADVLALVGKAHEVPVPSEVHQAVGIHQALAALIATDAVVRKSDRLSTTDGRLDLREVHRNLGGVPVAQEIHRDGACRLVIERARTPERQVLQREPKRLGIGELTFQKVKAGMQRRGLFLGEVDLAQVVVVPDQRVEVTLKGVVVGAMDGQTDTEGLQLAPVGVKPTQKRLVAHSAVAFDGFMNFGRRRRPSLCHQEGHE